MARFNIWKKNARWLPWQLLAAVILSVLLSTYPGDQSDAASVVLYRVNAGGPLVAATDGGPDWQEDSKSNPSVYHNNSSNTYSAVGGTVDGSVPGTTPPAIFDTERWDPASGAEMTWNFPIGSPGTYEVRFYLKNGYSGTGSAGQRIFSIQVEGNAYTELTDIDLSGSYGHQVGIMKSVLVDSDTSLDIVFLHNVENPLVNGIEILQVDTEGWLAVSPSAHNFGQVEVGTTGTQTFVLDNQGSSTSIVVDPVTLSGDFQASFPGATLAAGESATFDVAFTPSGLGTQSTSFDLTHDGSNSPVSVSLSGEGAYVTAAPISFTGSGLQGENINNPTSLQFGPDGRLYVSQQDGTIYAYTVSRNSATDYQVVATEQIDLIKTGVPNHQDDGSPNTTQKRQVTGILVTGTADNPILYVSSSDWRISVGQDIGLDTNSGVISRLTWVGSTVGDPNGYWDKVDIVRGLPRSEENHSTNGMVLDEASNTIYVMQGGNTNKGAPSNSFSGTPEYFFTSALLSVDLNAIEAMPIHTDPRTATNFVYDLRTLDDPERANIDNTSPDFPYPSNHPLYNASIDPGDPFGGNNGINMAIPEPDGPVQIYASGFRNAYDVVLTENGKLYTFDNGPNGNWGGMPLLYAADGTPKGYEAQAGVDFDAAAGDYCTNEINEGGSATHGDPLRLITGSGYYGGHPTPIRAFPALAGIYIYEDLGSGWTQQGVYNFGDLLPADLSIADFPGNPVECDYTSDQAYIDMLPASTNGITEYTASDFGGAMQGNILAASYDGNIYRYALNVNGDAYVAKEALFGGFGSTPLDVTTQGDGEVFPGTVWAATYGSDNITVFEPADSSSCSGTYSTSLDEDSDGYTNADELDSGTDPCSGGSKPPDNDGDFVSDLNDDDDDNDGILDPADPFATDAANGTTTNLPINYPFWNNDPGTGFFGLGFTGLMSNDVDDYLDLYDPTNMAAGGAAGMLSVEAVPAGTALGTANTQAYAFQFGFNAHSGTLPFSIHSQLEAPFFDAQPPLDSQAHGMYMGTGDQDNYLQIAVAANGGTGGIEVLLEENGSVTHSSMYDPATVGDILNAGEIDFYLTVDPAAGTVQPQVSLDGGVTILDLGAPLPIPASWLDPNDSQGVAAGVIATSTGSSTPFGATWDFMNVFLLDATADSQGSLSVTPNKTINASTYGNGSFIITNDSPTGQLLSSVEIDLRNGFLPDMVFDPAGTAGDLTAKCLSADSGAAATGFVAPADPCTDPFTLPHDSGYDAITLQFADFEPGETFAFSVDVDPTSIQGTSSPGPGESGSVSGLELTGAQATFVFEDGSVQTLALYRQPGSESGSTNIARAAAPAAPGLSIAGIPSTPATVTDDQQTAQITGAAGTAVSLLHVEAAFFQQTGGAFDPDPYEANSIILISEYAGTIGTDGTLEFPITLTDSDPEGGLNYLVAVVKETDGRTGDLSNVVILDYDSTYQPPAENVLYRVNAGGPELVAADGSNPLWSEDQSAANAAGSAAIGTPSPYVNATLSGDTTYGTDQLVSVQGAVPGSVPMALFQTQRHDEATLPEMEWDFPVAGGTEVELRLYLGEIYNGITAAGQRVFDVEVEGSVPAVFNSVDLYADNGLYVGSMYTTTALVDSDDNLDINFLHNLNNPVVNGIEVISLGQINNLPPTIEVIADQAVHETEMLAVPIVASDPDLDPLTLSAAIVDGNGDPAPFNPTVTEGELYATPQIGDAGSYLVTVTADDGRGGTATESFALTVTGGPVITILEPVEGASLAGDSVTVSWSTDYVTTTDHVHVTLDNNPYIGGQPLNGSYTFSGLPPGQHAITVQVAAYDHTVYTTSKASDTVSFSVPSAGTAIYRVNVGGAQVAAVTGIDWSADGSGDPSPYRTNGDNIYKTNGWKAYPGEIDMSHPSVPPDTPVAIFEIERYDSGSAGDPVADEMQWDFPVTSGSQIEVRLFFAELFSGIDTAGERVMDVAVEGTVPSAFANIDPFALSGPKGALMVSTVVTVGDDNLDLDFLHVVENPALKGIEILVLPSEPANSAPVIDPVADLTLTEGTIQTLTTTIVDADSEPVTVTVSSTPDASPFTTQTLTETTVGEYTLALDLAPLSGDAGTYSFVITADDGLNTPTDESFTLLVTAPDTTPPSISLLGDNPQVQEVFTAYLEAGATASDDRDGDLSDSIVIDATALLTDTLGNYPVTYNVSDGSGNAAETVTRTIIVTDTVAPVISLLGDNPQSVEAGTAYVEQGATAVDNYDGDLTTQIVVDASSVQTETLGSYIVSYDVTDSAGNAAATVTRTVSVTDTTAPAITLLGDDPLTLSIGNAYVEPGATATDTYDGALTAAIIIDATAVQTDTAGSYAVTYDVSDSSGNAATAVRTVNVVDTSGAILAVAPVTRTVSVGEIFTMSVAVQPGDLPVAGAAAYLDYDPAVLRVLSVTPGTALDTTLIEAEAINSLGHVNYEAGTLGTPLAAPFTLLTVEFQAVAAATDSPLSFSSASPRLSNAVHAGSATVRELVEGAVTVLPSDNGEVRLLGTVTLEGRAPAPDPSWAVPLRVDVYAPGGTTPLYQFTPTTDQSGGFTLAGIPAGAYDVAVKHSHSLQSIVPVVLSSGDNQIDFGILYEGDASDDNAVSLIDFSIMALTYNLVEGDSGYDARADFNDDGQVNLSDFSLLANNFGKRGTSP